MKKIIRVVCFILLFSIISGVLIGCGETNAIQNECEKRFKEGISGMDREVSSAGYRIEYKNMKTDVDYNKDTGKFKCTISATISMYLATNKSNATDIPQQVTYRGHMEGSKAVIDSAS